jgi:serine/threonine protein kinase
MIDVGSVVAGYVVESVLGTGGMGTGYVVRNPDLPRRDALKVLSAELSLNREFRCVRIRRDDPQRSGGEDRECHPGQNLPVRLGGFGRAQEVIFAAIALSRSTP